MIEPYAETLASHKLFTFIVQGFVVTEIEVVDVSTSADGLVNLDFLLDCRIYFRFEAL